MAEADTSEGGAGGGASRPGMDEAQLEAALEAMGYKKIQGAGGTAIWEGQGPTGKTDVNGDPVIATVHYSQEQLANATFPTSSPYLKQPAPNPGNSPDIRYDTAGRAQQWTGTAWVPNPTFDDPTKAAGYQAPRAPAAPLAPHIQVAEDGTIVRMDPYTGQPTVVGRVPELASTPTLSFQVNSNGDLVGINPKTGVQTVVSQGFGYKQLSPETIREQTVADAKAAREFTASENDKTRTATATAQAANNATTVSEGALNRGQTSAEAALGRALTAGEFAATLEQNRVRDEMTADQNYQQALRQYSQDKIAGAATVAGLVNTTDPTALPAFYAAGGGNIANAEKAGATAVSDRAVLPAAQALRANTERPMPTRFTVSYPTFDPSKYAAPYTPPATAAPAAAAAPVTPATPPAPAPAAAPPAGGVFTPGATPGYDGAASGTASSYTIAGAPSWVNNATSAGASTPRYSGGGRFSMGGPATGTFETGDSTDPVNPAAGGAHPEAVTLHDPPGPDNATADVTPLTTPGTGPTDDTGGSTLKFGEVLRAIGEMLIASAGASSDAAPAGSAGPQRFAYGTDPFLQVAPGDEPYMQQIRDIRTTAPYPALNPYSTHYRFEMPTVRSAYEMGEQGRYGVPVADQQQQQQFYAVPTASRGAFSLGV